MMYSQKYVLVHFFTPLQDGTEFHMDNWPLHITLADTFAIDRIATDIDKKLSELVSKSQTIIVSAIDDSTLGTTQVVLIEKTRKLQQLHNDIVSLLEANGATFNHPEFTKDGFLPHGTVQKNSRLQMGDEVAVDSISLIDMFPNNDWQHRKVLATFNLK